MTLEELARWLESPELQDLLGPPDYHRTNAASAALRELADKRYWIGKHEEWGGGKVPCNKTKESTTNAALAACGEVKA